jgi:hypothetical protein
MSGDGGVDEIAAQPSKTRQRAVLIRPGEPTVANHVRDQDHSDLALAIIRCRADFPVHEWYRMPTLRNCERMAS